MDILKNNMKIALALRKYSTMIRSGQAVNAKEMVNDLKYASDALEATTALLKKAVEEIAGVEPVSEIAQEVEDATKHLDKDGMIDDLIKDTINKALDRVSK